MTDNELIKALECCIANDNKCPDCPIFRSEICGKPALFFKEILDLINRQKAEIERLNGNLFVISNACMQRRNEAIEEFAYKLKETGARNNAGLIIFVESNIDKLVKGMVGDT